MTHMAATAARLPLAEWPVRPIVKWAGGKQALAPQLAEAFPDDFDRYFEPFVGGGSVFLELQPRSAVLSDQNEWLMETYVAVRDHCEAVAAILRRLPNTRRDYLHIRSTDPRSLDPTRRAAHFIYLNKTCFRGLFRVNRFGQFNVPYGEYDRRYFDPKNLRSVGECMERAQIRSGDFEFGLEGVSSRDFAYLDPPYYKLGGYSDFNRYTPCQFREKDHVRLAAVCRELDNRGVRWALTNSDTPLVHALYRGFRIRKMSARREINLASRKRDIVELLVTNY
jgi:DNA adenine methylase